MRIATEDHPPKAKRMRMLLEEPPLIGNAARQEARPTNAVHGSVASRGGSAGASPYQ